jgi:hypothetical protein
MARGYQSAMPLVARSLDEAIYVVIPGAFILNPLASDKRPPTKFAQGFRQRRRSHAAPPRHLGRLTLGPLSGATASRPEHEDITFAGIEEI